ncbi:hypothetical protein BV509_00890 [Rhodovulum sulfidophilum]|uniref:Helix-turn-helix protein n=1 Tax=Rhodovulum visakhapatnamense TaxID=364297 RepID=A0ABS1RGM8_9RHOB|nr:hypothetical protein [Rhodovulum visakhapatnamense]MBL3569892.1 hypothetical protein [Rhodovulum visakhapatnamense]MBL3578415.1 hypothetical protein [Rhodovulum visakhapatnamense]OLS43045.1 hypothetical protein BV509_00890 [Rhodovulum sulfidophilum]
MRRPIRYSIDQIQRAAELREAGLTFPEIASQLGMKRTSVEYHCMRLGADPAARRQIRQGRGAMIQKRGNHLVRRFSTDDDATLMALVEQGLRHAEIARRMGRAQTSIAGRLVTLARAAARGEDE